MHCKENNAMNQCLTVVLLSFFTLGIATLGRGQELNPQSCQQNLQTTCTRCHGLKKICTKLDQAGADWKTIIATMGKRGNLSQDTQDTVVVCLTASSEPKKLVCDK